MAKEQNAKGGEARTGEGIPLVRCEQLCPPVPVSWASVEDVVRVLKTGLFYHPVVAPDVRIALAAWTEERESEIDAREGRDRRPLSQVPANEEEGADSQGVGETPAETSQFLPENTSFADADQGLGEI